MGNKESEEEVVGVEAGDENGKAMVIIKVVKEVEIFQVWNENSQIEENLKSKSQTKDN